MRTGLHTRGRSVKPNPKLRVRKGPSSSGNQTKMAAAWQRSTWSPWWRLSHLSLGRLPAACRTLSNHQTWPRPPISLTCMWERRQSWLLPIWSFITLSPSWSCSPFPITEMNANIHCAWHQTYFFQPQFGYNEWEWSKIMMATPWWRSIALSQELFGFGTGYQWLQSLQQIRKGYREKHCQL